MENIIWYCKYDGTENRGNYCITCGKPKGKSVKETKKQKNKSGYAMLTIVTILTILIGYSLMANKKSDNEIRNSNLTNNIYNNTPIPTVANYTDYTVNPETTVTTVKARNIIDDLEQIADEYALISRSELIDELESKNYSYNEAKNAVYHSNIDFYQMAVYEFDQYMGIYNDPPAMTPNEIKRELKLKEYTDDEIAYGFSQIEDISWQYYATLVVGREELWNSTYDEVLQYLIDSGFSYDISYFAAKFRFAGSKY